MRQAPFIATFALVVAATGLAAQEPADDRQSIKGTWTLAAMQLGDQAGLEKQERFKDFSVVITAERITVQFSKDVRREANYKLDPAKSPKEIDLTYLDGPDKGLVSPAIYKLDGDTLTLCGTGARLPRPTEFKPRPGGKEILMVLKRAKP